jgi:hypothetical protein
VNIHQLNLGYLPDQDRVLARINTTTGVEFRLWFTRRLTIGLLPVLRKVLADQVQRSLSADPAESGLFANDPKAREFLGEFKKEQALQQADFKTPYKALATEVAAQEPLLVSEVQMTPLANGQVEIKFSAKPLQSGNKAEVRLALDHKLMHGLLHLLEKSFNESKWGQVALAGVEGEPAADPPVAATRPQYLN